ncbi:sensor histidine kinase [Nocardioides speluncae]|uniref:sensor histidine kinase n=1 Tax=Nocardioides speluncae TaxID=2670337 RepID=UPI0012B16A9B|nr:histidine kinase [Nocardioides speluncae]
MTPRSVVAVCAVPVVAFVAAVPLAVRASGFDDFGNHPVIVLPMAAATITLLLAAALLPGRTHRGTRTCLGWTGTALFVYLTLTAALAWYGGERGARDKLTELLVAAQGVAWAPPITLLTLTFLVALSDLGVNGRAIRRLGRGIVAYSVIVLPFALLTTPPPPDSPYAQLPPVWDAPVLAAVASLLFVPWMLAIFLGPAVAWRALPEAPAEVRGRVLAVALAAMTPPVTIVFCLAATLLAYVAGVLSVEVGAGSLSVAYHLPFVLAGPAVVYALRGPGDTLSARHVTSALTVTVGTPLLIVAVTLAWLLAAQAGAGGAALVVLGTLAFGAVFGVARRRLIRGLLLRVDPVRARAVARLAASDGAASPALELERFVRAVLTEEPETTVSVRLPRGEWVYADSSAAPPPDEPTTPTVHVEPTSADAATALHEARGLVDRAVLELTVRDQEASLRAAAARTQGAAATERKRLERDLHDGVQGRLLALALDLRVAQRTLPGGEAHLVIADAVDALSKAIDELRALSQGTGSDLLSRRGLRAALTEFTGQMPLPVNLVQAPYRLVPAAESVIYLAVCEAVTNAVKHARATRVDIDITTEDDVALVTVSDDGVGGADLRAGTGLQGLSERVAAAGGRLVVSDRTPHGTLLEVTVPCGS